MFGGGSSPVPNLRPRKMPSIVLGIFGRGRKTAGVKLFMLYGSKRSLGSYAHAPTSVLIRGQARQLPNRRVLRLVAGRLAACLAQGVSCVRRRQASLSQGYGQSGTIHAKVCQVPICRRKLGRGRQPGPVQLDQGAPSAKARRRLARPLPLQPLLSGCTSLAHVRSQSYRIPGCNRKCGRLYTR